MKGGRAKGVVSVGVECKGGVKMEGGRWKEEGERWQVEGGRKVGVGELWKRGSSFAELGSNVYSFFRHSVRKCAASFPATPEHRLGHNQQQTIPFHSPFIHLFNLV